MNELFNKYLDTYIRLLTKGQEEYFIAVVDIEKDMGKTFLSKCSEKQEYKAAWFDRNDYSNAVVLRNDRFVSKLVLLSNDSVKMIDSLKDFVEYPAVPEDKEILWDCLTAAFGVPLEGENKKIVEMVLDNQRIAVEELLEYLSVCLAKTGFDTKKIKKNLYRLDIWTTNKENPPKHYLRKMIRHSDPFVIENKLIRGMTDGLVSVTPKETTDILNALSSNNFQEIYKNICYERVEKVFKGAKRKPAGTSREKQEEQKYEHSYEYAIQEQSEEPMESLETWLMAKEQKELLEESCQKYKFPSEEEIEEAFNKLYIQAGQLNLSERDIFHLQVKLRYLKTCCWNAMEEAKQYTPAYLYHYAESQNVFVENYVNLLGMCLTNSRISRMCVGTGFLNGLQNLFCTNEHGAVQMPFYHPIIGFYYLTRKRKYEQGRELLNKKPDAFIKAAVKSFMEKEAADFPVKYILWDRELYQLDYTSLRNWPDSVSFSRAKEIGSGSWVNVRLLNEDLLDYIERHKYLAEIRVTIVDINDISEIMFLIRKLRNLPNSEDSMVHKVILNIISGKEEELKQQLQINMEMDLEYPQMLFRFTRELYMQGDEYDFKRIVADSDLLFLADSNFLYQKPRLSEWKGDTNWLQIDIEKWSANNLLAKQIQQDHKIIEIMWDSIHYMELEEQVKMVNWNAQELKPSLLSQIRQAIQENTKLTVVVLSSNTQLFHHISHLKEFQVRKRLISGQELLLFNFHKGCSRTHLQEEGETAVRIALIPFLEEILGEEELWTLVLFEEGDTKEEPYLTVRYEDGRFFYQCKVYRERKLDDKERNQSGQHYEVLVDDLLFLCNQNEVYKSKFINVLYESAKNYKAALMVDYLKHNEIKKDNWNYKEISAKEQFDTVVDIADLFRFQSMMEFVRAQKSIDEYSVNRFYHLYHEDMLKGCLNADRQIHLLDRELIEKIKKLYAKAGEVNE